MVQARGVVLGLGVGSGSYPQDKGGGVVLGGPVEGGECCSFCKHFAGVILHAGSLHFGAI